MPITGYYFATFHSPDEPPLFISYVGYGAGIKGSCRVLQALTECVEKQQVLTTTNDFYRYSTNYQN